MKALEQRSRTMISIQLNGQTRHGGCDNRTSLVDFLRHELGATGTHVGCEHGVCGACTVRVDGVAVRACMMLAAQAEGSRVDTVEGLARSAAMSDLQQAFKRRHALQCGFCTAGILMSCSDFLERLPDPTETEVREMLSGHLCRCTGYTNIVMAVLDVAASRRASAPAERKDHHA
ncbi:(2Fe-2S)-binding protein [Pigmentiphaga litoralis]|uniref:(2Fe-2S)-binding protein n=1 Tax=Pigmentiphaga litoralis TaxID=516702 RepID=UPI003B438F2D